MHCDCSKAVRDAFATITINGRDYVSDEAAAANTREATEPLLAEIERLRSVVTDHYNALCNRDATIADLRAQLASGRLVTTFDADVDDEDGAVCLRLYGPANQLVGSVDVTENLVTWTFTGEEDGLVDNPAARLPSGPVTAADVQRAREAQGAAIQAKYVGPTAYWRLDPDDPTHWADDEPILPAMTIPDDGRVDAGWPGADGGRDG